MPDNILCGAIVICETVGAGFLAVGEITILSVDIILESNAGAPIEVCSCSALQLLAALRAGLPALWGLRYHEV